VNLLAHAGVSIDSDDSDDGEGGEGDDISSRIEAMMRMTAELDLGDSR